MSENLLEIKNLKIQFNSSKGRSNAVNGVSFNVKKGETVGIVGESGCGKSVTSLSIMGLIPSPPGEIAGGEILFNDENLLEKSEVEMQKIRGNKISMIFQEPMTSLNPVLTCGEQITEMIRLHQGVNKQDAKKKAIKLLELVGIPSPERRINEYPHQLSGGLRQRVMIAIALSCNPQLLIADEPTTALDVTIQAQILELIKKLKDELGMSIMLITHDLGVVAEMADEVVVMYAGKVVEKSDVKSLFKNTLHPYTEGLLNSIPRLDEDKDELHTIEGVVPNPLEIPRGCSFNPRCKFAQDICLNNEPPLIEVEPGCYAACWKYDETKKELFNHDTNNVKT